jgi:hypothetical protein
VDTPAQVAQRTTIGEQQMPFTATGSVQGFIRVVVSAACAIALVSGCGGGGGDDSAILSTDFAVQSAAATYFQSAHQFTLTGTVGASTLSMNYSYTPGAASMFEGQSALTAVENATLLLDGVVVDVVTSTSFFALSPFTFFGSTEAGSYSVLAQTANLPGTARIGQSGTIGVETEYTDSTKAVVVGTSTITWSLEPDTQSTALFCINMQSTSGAPVSGSQCYRIDAAGVPQGLVVRVDVNGQTVTLR